MKKILGIIVLGLLYCNITFAKEFYLACMVSMVEDRSTIKLNINGDVFGFQYFKFDNTNSEITIHEQIDIEKPAKIGSIKIDYDGKKIIDFEIKNEGSVDTYKLINSIDLSLIKYNWSDFRFESSVYLKSDSKTIDYDFKSTECIAPLKKGKVLKPSKAKKLYKKWIKKGF
tara:strand:+ start:72 stop:584 length:513 start_codon:yes stop_codon:yes gene_type:complete